MNPDDHPAMGPRTLYFDCADCGERTYGEYRRTRSFTDDTGMLRVESLCPSCSDQRIADDPAGPPPEHPARK